MLRDSYMKIVPLGSAPFGIILLSSLPHVLNLPVGVGGVAPVAETVGCVLGLFGSLDDIGA